ncbi:hypothetical protein [Nocardia sp. NPDC127526]|uniref:hypothetical protein n=1 Tax=Nocardia sp. NPDC127526 TaxID=3345393 RepID=UPI00363FFBD7
MKYPKTNAALAEWTREKGTYERGLPEEPGEAHAFIPWKFTHQYTLGPRIQTDRPTFLEGGEAERAACGKFVKVLLPMEFDDSDPDACPKCVRQVELWAFDPQAWKTAQQNKENARYRRKYPVRLTEADLQSQADVRRLRAAAELGDSEAIEQLKGLYPPGNQDGLA